jgi:hypothetical protein
MKLYESPCILNKFNFLKKFYYFFSCVNTLHHEKKGHTITNLQFGFFGPLQCDCQLSLLVSCKLHIYQIGKYLVGSFGNLKTLHVVNIVGVCLFSGEIRLMSRLILLRKNPRYFIHGSHVALKINSQM